MFEPDIRHGRYQDALKAGEKFQLGVTSPGYNIGSRGPRRDGRRRQGLYDPRSFGGITGYADRLPEEQYQQGQVNFLLHYADHMTDDGVLAYNVKPRRKDKLIIFPTAWILRPEVQERLVVRDVATWDRGSTHNHDRTQLWYQTEHVYILGLVGGTYRFRNSGLSDVWRIPFQGAKTAHDCAFPIELAMRIIECWSEPGDIVCDPHLGSGTSAIAAMRLGRRFVGTECVEDYHKLALERVARERREWEIAA